MVASKKLRRSCTAMVAYMKFNRLETAAIAYKNSFQRPGPDLAVFVRMLEF